MNWRLERRHLFRYLVAGGLNAAVSFPTIYVCLIMGFSPIVSNIGGFSVGILISFFLSKSFVFESRRRSRPEAAKFVLAFCVSYLANILALEFLTRHTDFPQMVAQVGAISVYVGMMFCLGRLVVFRGGINDRLREHDST